MSVAVGATHGRESLDARFAGSMGQLLGPDFPGDIGLAVSGGGDSMAMLYLAHNWTRVYGLGLRVVTVDHGLRAEAAEEAAMVAAECGALGWPHTTLQWHWDGRGNVQDAARRARLELIDRWRGGLDHVLMAHTRDDLAETFLMRLARGSGVEGLSAMASRRVIARRPEHQGLPPSDEETSAAGCAGPMPQETGNAVSSGPMIVIRPCLDMRRAELRHYLRTLQGRWAEDPTNEDPTFDRVRMRRLLDLLEPEGLGVETLAATASRMARAKEALIARAISVWHEIGSEGQAMSAPTGDILLNRSGFGAAEQDTRMRLLAAALQYVSSSGYRPRADATEALLDRVLAGGAGTLQGCEVRTSADEIHIFRETSAVAQTVCTVGAQGLWDNRWRVYHGKLNGLTVRALGEDGWAQCLPRTEGTPDFRTARALPSIWDGDRLVACDAMGLGPGGTTELVPLGRDGGFSSFLLSH